MEIGYIKLYRKVTNSFVWTNPHMFKLWALCLMKATHKESRFLFNGQEVVLSSGQFVTGRDAIAKEFNEGVKRDQQIAGRTLWRWLKKFETEQMLSIKSNTKYSVISINHWHEYQVSDQQVSSTRPTDVHHLSTYKNDKNVKNEKNNIIINKPLEFYEKNGFGTIAPVLVEEVGHWVNEFEQAGNSTEDANQLIIKAMEFGVKNNARNWNYVNKILLNWKQRGLTTIEKVEAAEKQRQEKQASQQTKTKFYSKPPVRKETLPEWAEKQNEVKDKPLSPEEQQAFKERLNKIRGYEERMIECRRDYRRGNQSTETEK